MNKKKKALILVSGGLDSALAACVIREQGVEVKGINFINPTGSGRRNRFTEILEKKQDIPVKYVGLGEEFCRIIEEPEYGYGKNMNPCIDCKILMLSKVKKMIDEGEADFAVTGEVLGQRPMSQHRRALDMIARESGMGGLLVRPLSAHYFGPTIPEKNGWLDRNRLLDISGRSRKVQLSLAEKFGMSHNDFSTPAGGCRLTMKEYSEKLKDILKHEGNISELDLSLLGMGRHLRVNDSFKIVVGRDEGENRALDKTAPAAAVRMWCEDSKGPLCIGLGRWADAVMAIMAGICGRYGDCEPGEEALFSYKAGSRAGHVRAVPFDPEQILKYKIY